jgi:thiamine-phosphate pyrophosphorylase
MIDLRLIAVLDPEFLGSTDIVGLARAVAAAGATAMQLRMKRAGAGDYARLASRLVAAVPIPVFVNDRADVAWAAGAAGVHVGADDLPAAQLRQIFRAPLAIGVSVGNRAEAAAVPDAAADYWSIGAVYATPHKADAGPPLGPDGLRQLASLAPPGVPVVAIGGITAERIPAVFAAGARGAAVIGAIFAAPDPAAATARIRAAIDAALV